MANNDMPNLSEMRKLMAQEAQIAEANGETPVVGGMAWAMQGNENNEEKVTNNEPHSSYVVPTPVTVQDAAPEVNETPKEYTGPGMVIEAKEEPEPQHEYTGISPATQSYIDAYMAEMDATIDEQKKMEEENPQTNDTEKAKTPEEEFNESYEEAVVVIDKLGMGRVIDFTEEERAKLTKVKTIKLNEIEMVPIETFHTKKIKDPKSLTHIIKGVNTLHTTAVCLPLSGYTAKIKGCTAYELMSLLDGGANALLDAQTKWSLIHSKIESTSIGDMTFNEFLYNTAAGDYNNFIYGILCATYPEMETTTFKCTDCKTTYEHPYSVRQLIRAERMSDKLREHFSAVVDAAISTETAMAVHEDSPIKLIKRIRLPISGIIVEVQVQSAYDLINNSLKAISDTDDPETKKFNAAMVIATLIRRVLVPDPEDPDSMYEFTDSSDIAQIVYQLRERDILIIKNFGDELMGDMTIDYGFMNIKCPKCGKYIAFSMVDIEDLLFQRYRQELSASIE